MAEVAITQFISLDVQYWDDISFSRLYFYLPLATENTLHEYVPIILLYIIYYTSLAPNAQATIFNLHQLCDARTCLCTYLILITSLLISFLIILE